MHFPFWGDECIDAGPWIGDLGRDLGMAPGVGEAVGIRIPEFPISLVRL